MNAEVGADFDINKMNSHAITAGLRPALVGIAPLGLGVIPNHKN